MHIFHVEIHISYDKTLAANVFRDNIEKNNHFRRAKEKKVSYKLVYDLITNSQHEVDRKRVS